MLLLPLQAACCTRDSRPTDDLTGPFSVTINRQVDRMRREADQLKVQSTQYKKMLEGLKVGRDTDPPLSMLLPTTHWLSGAAMVGCRTKSRSWTWSRSARRRTTLR